MERASRSDTGGTGYTLTAAPTPPAFRALNKENLEALGVEQPAEKDARIARIHAQRLRDHNPYSNDHIRRLNHFFLHLSAQREHRVVSAYNRITKTWVTQGEELGFREDV